MRKKTKSYLKIFSLSILLPLAVGGLSAFLTMGNMDIYKELQQGDTGALDKNLRSEYSAELAQRKTTESLKNRGRNLEEAAALFVKKRKSVCFLRR